MLNSPYDRFTIDYISSNPGSKKPNHAIPHFHNTNEIVLAVSGRSISICGDEVLHLNAPYIIHYPVGVVHEQMNESAVPYLRYCFSIDPSYIESETSSGAARIPCGFFGFELTQDEFARLDELARLLLRFCYFTTKLSPNDARDITNSLLPTADIPEPRREALSKSRLRHLLTLFLDELAPIAERRKTPEIPKRLEYIRDVCKFISEAYGSKLTLDMLSEKFYISRTKLTRDFRLVMNMSFCDYLTMVRISRSKQLLEETSESVAEIAYRCGFSSASHFIETFRRFNNCTPSEFRIS